MKLNPDCIRDILLAVEDYLIMIGVFLTLNYLNQNF